MSSSCVLYIGAIPYHWDVPVIKSVVCGSGPIVDVRCMMDSHSKNKGFCFVEYSSPIDALNALNILTKLKIEGRKKLRIELSKEGLRNNHQLRKPVLKLNRLLLPANVIVPMEMLNKPEMIGDIDDETDDLELSTLINSIRNNNDLQKMVSQMLANGMDLHQVASIVAKSTSNQEIIPNNNNNMNNMNNNNMNMNMNNLNNMNNMNMNNNMMNMNNMNNMNNNMMNSMNMNNMNMNNMMGNNMINNNMMGNNMMNNNMMNNNMLNNNMMNMNNMNNSLLNNNNNSNGMNILPNPTNNQLNPANASTYLPILPIPPQQDLISTTLSTIPPGILIELLAKLKMVLSSPNSSNEAVTILNENPKLAIAAAQALVLMGLPKSKWPDLSYNTVLKLLQLPPNEAELVVQVLRLSDQQLAALPREEYGMAVNIRSQYL